MAGAAADAVRRCPTRLPGPVSVLSTLGTRAPGPQAVAAARGSGHLGTPQELLVDVGRRRRRLLPRPPSTGALLINCAVPSARGWEPSARLPVGGAGAAGSWGRGIADGCLRSVPE